MKSLYILAALFWLISCGRKEIAKVWGGNFLRVFREIEKKETYNNDTDGVVLSDAVDNITIQKGLSDPSTPDWYSHCSIQP